MTAPDDSILVALSCRQTLGTVDPTSQLGIVRLHPDGDIDRDFGSEGFAIHPRDEGFRGIEPYLLPNGSILVRGDLANVPVIARFNADGSVDTAFAGEGIRTLDLDEYSLLDVNVVPLDDGRILVLGGAVHKKLGSTDGIVIRLLANGAFDPSFHGTGLLSVPFRGGPDGNARSGLPQGDRFVLAGNTESEALLRRYLSDGKLDAAFGKNGEYAVPVDDINVSVMSFVRLLATKEGKFVAMGNDGRPHRRGFLVGIDADGHSDAGFAGGQLAQTPTHIGTCLLLDVMFDLSGKIVVSGIGGDFFAHGFFVGRYTASGVLDESFGDRGFVYVGFGDANELSRGFTVQGNRGILLSGQVVGADELNHAIVMRVPHTVGDQNPAE